MTTPSAPATPWPWRHTVAALVPPADVDALRARRDNLLAALATTYATAHDRHDQETR